MVSTKLFDFTQLDAIARCEAEHGYRYQQHLARAEPDASAFFGQVVHVGVRNLFAGTHEPDGLAETWGDFVAPPKKAHLTLQYAQRIVEMYAEQYGMASEGHDLVKDGLAMRGDRPIGAHESTLEMLLND